MIDSTFFVTETFDIVAILILLGMCMTPKSAGEKEGLGTKLFVGMGVSIIAGAVLDLFSRMPFLYTEDGPLSLVLFLPALAEIAVMSFMFFLLLYTDYVFFESRDHLRRHFGPYMIPLIVIATILIVNAFSGILYTTGADGVLSISALGYVLEATEYLYLLVPAVHFLICFKKYGNRKFLHPLSITIPIVFGAVLTLLTPFTVIYMGFATGLAFLVFSRIDSRRFLDADTGFYNRAYLRYITELIRQQKVYRKGMILFDVSGDNMAFADILKKELPGESEVVFLSKGHYVYLPDTGNLMEFEAVAELVRCGVDEYCEDHPENLIDISTSFRMFKDSIECAKVIEDKLNLCI